MQTQGIGFNPETFEVTLTTGEKIFIRQLTWGEKKKLWKTNKKLIEWFKKFAGEAREGEININPLDIVEGLYELSPDDIEQIVRLYYQGDINRLTDIDILNIILGHTLRLFQG